jgi:hypothetical protein
MPPELSEKYWTEQEMASILRITLASLRGRRSRGTEHPPYIEVRRGFVLYPKDMALSWLDSRRIIYEVKGAS